MYGLACLPSPGNDGSKAARLKGDFNNTCHGKHNITAALLYE